MAWSSASAAAVGTRRLPLQLEQAHAERIAELLQVARDRRLGDAERLRRARRAAEADDRLERGELGQGAVAQVASQGGGREESSLPFLVEGKAKVLLVPEGTRRRRGLMARIDDESDVPADRGANYSRFARAARGPRVPPFWQARSPCRRRRSSRRRVDRSRFAIASRIAKLVRAAASQNRASPPDATARRRWIPPPSSPRCSRSSSSTSSSPATTPSSSPWPRAACRSALQKRAIVWGAIGAIGVRSLMTVIVVWLLHIPGLLLAGGLAPALDRLPAAAARRRSARHARAGAGDVLGRDANDRHRRRGDGPRQRPRRRRRGARQLPARRRRPRHQRADRRLGQHDRAQGRRSLSRASSTSAPASSSGRR